MSLPLRKQRISYTMELIILGEHCKLKDKTCRSYSFPFYSNLDTESFGEMEENIFKILSNTQEI